MLQVQCCPKYLHNKVSNQLFVGFVLFLLYLKLDISCWVVFLLGVDDLVAESGNGVDVGLCGMANSSIVCDNAI